jgi:hypothetical protein
MQLSAMRSLKQSLQTATVHRFEEISGTMSNMAVMIRML